MSPLTDRIDGYRAALAEVEAAALAVMHDMKNRVLAAGNDEAQGLMLSFERAARTAQRCVAINLRLDFELSRQDREVRAVQKAETEARVERRKAEVRCVLERQTWSQLSNRNLAQATLCSINEILAEDGFKADFADWPIEAYIQRLRYDVGLDTAASPEDQASPPPRGVLWRPRPTGEFYPPYEPGDDEDDLDDEDAALEAEYENSA